MKLNEIIKINQKNNMKGLTVTDKYKASRQKERMDEETGLTSTTSGLGVTQIGLPSSVRLRKLEHSARNSI